MLALDWKKTFDSINVDGLLSALTRFGLPEHFVSVIRAIYSDRVFEVKDCGVTSAKRRQLSGICQGCPLSPYLFVIVMTILMHDAHAALGVTATAAVHRGDLYDILYADDTLV